MNTPGSDSELETPSPLQIPLPPSPLQIPLPPPPPAAAAAPTDGVELQLSPTKKDRGISLTLEPPVDYGVVANSVENDILTVMREHNLIKVNKIIPPQKFISFGEQIRKRFMLENIDNIRYTGCKAVENEICKYTICVSKLIINSSPNIADDIRHTAASCRCASLIGKRRRFAGGSSAAATDDQEQLEQLNSIKATVDSSGYNSVAIKVYGISTKLNVSRNPLDRETRCWAKALNMFLEEIYYQTAAHKVIKDRSDEDETFQVKSPDVIISFYNFDKANNYLELYIVSEWIDVEDLEPKERKISHYWKKSVQKKVEEIDDVLQKSPYKIYHNDLYKYFYRNPFDKVAGIAPKSITIHKGNVKRENGTGDIVILDFGAARDHKADARGVFKKKRKKSKKLKKSKKSKKSKKPKKSKKHRKSKKLRKSKKTRKSKKRRKSKKLKKSKKRKTKKRKTNLK